jgi:hypothetical protein
LSLRFHSPLIRASRTGSVDERECCLTHRVVLRECRVVLALHDDPADQPHDRDRGGGVVVDVGADAALGHAFRDRALEVVAEERVAGREGVGEVWLLLDDRCSPEAKEDADRRRVGSDQRKVLLDDESIGATTLSSLVGETGVGGLGCTGFGGACAVS